MMLDECFEWRGNLNNKGYGTKRFSKYGGLILTHRLAYAWANGLWGANGPEIPRGMKVLHSCDNPACCNPAHLTSGTQAANMRDCANKGRFHNQRKTHCKRGHELAGDNLYVMRSGSRSCRQCQDYRHKRWRDKRREMKYAVHIG